MSIARKYIQDRSGMAAVEAALVFPFLVTAGFGSIDASYMVLQSHKMESSLTSAANYLAQTDDPQNFETQAKRLAATGQIKSGGSPILPNWSETDVVVSYRDVANTPMNDGTSYNGGDTIKIIQVSSTLTYQGLGFMRSITGGTTQIDATSEARLTGR